MPTPPNPRKPRGRPLADAAPELVAEDDNSEFGDAVEVLPARPTNGHGPATAEVIENWAEFKPDPNIPPLPENMQTFEVAYRERPPIPFKVVCETRPAEPGGPKGRREFVFWCNANAGSGGVLAMSGLIHYDDKTGKPIGNLNAIKAFFARVLLFDGYEKFLEMEDDPDIDVDMDQLNAIMSFLIGKITGRP
jgi:hypothetical protein